MSSKALIFVFLLFARFADAQLSVDWYKNSGELNIYSPKKSVYNSADSCIYTTGVFSGQFEMDGTLIASSYLKAFFLMKTKSNGELVWLKKIAENDYWVEIPSNVALTVDDSGDLLLGITFNRKLFFGSDSIVLPDDPVTTGGVLIKLDTSATEIWHKQIFTSSIQCVASNGSNEVFLTGRTAINDDVYLTAYSEAGDSLWTRYGGSNSGYDEGKQIQIDENDNIYLVGFIDVNNAIYFDSEHPTFVSPFFWGSFLAKYNSSGQIQWIRCFYSSNFGEYVVSQSIVLVGNRVLVVGASKGNAVKFYPVSSALASLSPNLTCSFILCYDSFGGLIWKKAPHESINGGTGLELGVSLNGLIVSKGTFSESFVTAGDTLVSQNNDLFLEAFDTLGNSIWHKQINGSNFDGATSFFRAGDDLVLNISTKSNTLQLDNTIMTLAPVSDQMVLVRFNYETLALSENESASYIISPNPATDIITVSGNAFEKVEIMDLSGRVVLTSNEKQINIAALQPGQYILRVGESTQRFVKQ